MRNSSSRKKASPALYLQAAVILLVAAVVVAVLFLSNSGASLPLNQPTPAAAPSAATRLIFDLNAGSQSSIARFGFLDEQGITSTISVPLPIGATYSLQHGYLVATATSNRAATQFFTATYAVRNLTSQAVREFSADITGTNQIGDLYTFSSALLSPDANSIAYLLDHQQFIDNGLRVRLTWTLYRADLTAHTKSTIASGQLDSTNVPGASTAFWSSATNQIYLNLRSDASVQRAPDSPLYPYDADGHGPGKQITIPSLFTAPSPDGSKIAYLSSTVATFTPQFATAGNEIIVQDLQSNDRQTISAAAGNSIEPGFDWSPDNRSLSYVERIAPPTPLADKQAAGDLFYHIQLKRFDMGASNSLNLSEYRASTNVNAFTTSGQVLWCGSRIYLQLSSFPGSERIASNLYFISADGSGGLHLASPAAWHYPLIECIQ